MNMKKEIRMIHTYSELRASQGHGDGGSQIPHGRLCSHNHVCLGKPLVLMCVLSQAAPLLLAALACVAAAMVGSVACM